tara:strand:- start:450 stop:860 length:411 start_codon:yes stop_codon:yes gene_type:complete
MSTHALLGLKHKDGKITGAYIHYDGYPEHMIGAIVDFVQKKSLTGLFLTLVQGQEAGGIRAFNARNGTTFSPHNDGPYIIDENTWDLDDINLPHYKYLVDIVDNTIEWHPTGECLNGDVIDIDGFEGTYERSQIRT